jgi:hypothetical protein
MAAHWACVLAHFAGVVCLDDVHDRGRTLLLATDPLGDFPVSGKLVATNAQDPMNAF